MSDTVDHAQHLAEAETRIINLPPGAEFVSSEIEAALRKEGWPPLAEPRALGHTLLRLRRRGYITKSGAMSTAVRSHGGVATVWRRTTQLAEQPVDESAGAGALVLPLAIGGACRSSSVAEALGETGS
ncbi:hypothetical protein [Nocardia salmonicida]|uniref:hypothetical protein n=1 Tax=Nocardia salmonicida TaxID=53431 RepID=UPI00363AB572